MKAWQIGLGLGVVAAGIGALVYESKRSQAQAVVSLAVSGAATVTAGTSHQLAATATMSDGTTKDVTGSVVWASSNPTIATITSSGLVAAIAAGTAQITATLGSVVGTFSLTVTSGQGVQLYASSNNPTSYTGPGGTPEEVFASVLSNITEIAIAQEGSYHIWPASLAAQIGMYPLTYINSGDFCYISVKQDCFWTWPASGSLPPVPSRLVTVTFRAKNYPANAVYWGIVGSSGYCPFYLMDDPIMWTDVDKDVLKTEGCAFVCNDVNYQQIPTPNGGSWHGWNITLIDGATYYIDFAQGQIVDAQGNIP